MMWSVCYLPDLYTVISTTAINSMGYSGMTLKMQILTIVPNFLFVIIVVILSSSPISVMIAKVALIPYNFYVTAFFLRKAIGYKITEQIKDLLPNLLLTIGMSVVLYFMNSLNINGIVVLFLQGIVAIFIYYVLSISFKVKGYCYLAQLIKTVNS